MSCPLVWPHVLPVASQLKPTPPIWYHHSHIKSLAKHATNPLQEHKTKLIESNRSSGALDRAAKQLGNWRTDVDLDGLVVGG